MIRRLDLGTTPPLALASGGDGVWVADRNRVAAYDAETGAQMPGRAYDVPGDRSAATPVSAAGDVVALADATGIVLLRPGAADAPHRVTTPDVTTPDVPTTITASTDRFWAGAIGAPWIAEIGADGDHRLHRLEGDLAGLTADDDGAWWVEAGDDRVRNGDRSVRLPGRVGPTIGIAAAAGAIWVSTTDGLLLVRPRTADLGPTIGLPEEIGRIERLAAVPGALVGGDTLDRIVVLDPARDTGPRLVDLGDPGPVASIAGARGVVWVAGVDGIIRTFPL